MVKVDDTELGIEKRLYAGIWLVAVWVSGNAMGLSLADLQALSPEMQDARLATAVANLKGAGAQYVTGSTADL